MSFRPCISRLALVAAISVGCGSESPRNDPVGQTQLIRPAERLRVAPGVPVAIEWSSSLADSATVDLFADADGDPETTSDQLPLSLGNAAVAGSTVFTWRTAEVPFGSYHVIARRIDRLGTHVTTAPGVVEVVEPLLSVGNLEVGERLRYPLALLSGTVPTDTSEVSAGLVDEPRRPWPAHGGRFKVLVRLVPGANDVLLEAGGVLHRFAVTYTPMTNPRIVRFVYMLAADSEGRFDAPEGAPNDVASALRRIGTAAELMQTFMAESLDAEGFGRRTFRLARDKSGAPLVETFRSSLTTAQARAMRDYDLYFHLERELAALPDHDWAINVVILSTTHFDPAQQQVVSHTALGGNQLALFGSGGLHTWAESLDEVAARFLDERRIDRAALFDDSNGRGTYWANYATGVGAALHELSHCFSLLHPTNNKGVMMRDFDFFNRTFMVEEPESELGPAFAPVLPEQEPGWDRSSAVRLGFHRWLDPDNARYAVNEIPVLSETATSVTFSSKAGVRHIAWGTNDFIAWHSEFLQVPPPSVTEQKSVLKERFPGETKLRVSVIDADGNIGEREVLLQE